MDSATAACKQSCGAVTLTPLSKGTGGLVLQGIPAQSASFKEPLKDVKNKLTVGLQGSFCCASPSSLVLEFLRAVFQSFAVLWTKAWVCDRVGTFLRRCTELMMENPAKWSVSLKLLAGLVPFKRMTAPSSKLTLPLALEAIPSVKSNLWEWFWQCRFWSWCLKQFKNHFLKGKRKIRLEMLEALLCSYSILSVEMWMSIKKPESIPISRAAKAEMPQIRHECY